MERKGLFTEDQERILDELIKLKGIPEKIDGIVIRLIDNKAINILIKNLSKETKTLIWDIVDMLFDGLEEIVKK